MSVWRCSISGVIFLEGCDIDYHTYYTRKAVDCDHDLSVTESHGVSHATLCQEDDARRAEQFKDYVRGKVWLDFGAGEGGLLQIMAHKAAEAYAYELNSAQCARMHAKGIPVLDDWRTLADQSLDVITLFHVFEHLPRPVELLSELARKLSPGGVAIVEVPHANDFLIKLLNCEAFKRFTFWSEHLVLHTRASLEAMLRLAGFEEVVVTGFQRYSLANHLYWLRHARPGGHELWGAIETCDMKRAYAAMLANIDQTDTLVAVGRKVNLDDRG
jgi:2-polyprenyl-3-methyl-5-hydroxy-6-metoxy-1,4-benzoquinol methylase